MSTAHITGFKHISTGVTICLDCRDNKRESSGWLALCRENFVCSRCGAVSLSYEVMDGDAKGCTYYVVWDSALGQIGGGQIRRRHPGADGRSFMVASIGVVGDWEVFRDAIDAGFNEVDAVKEMAQ